MTETATRPSDRDTRGRPQDDDDDGMVLLLVKRCGRRREYYPIETFTVLESGQKAPPPTHPAAADHTNLLSHCFVHCSIYPGQQMNWIVAEEQTGRRVSPHKRLKSSHQSINIYGRPFGSGAGAGSERLQLSGSLLVPTIC